MVRDPPLLLRLLRLAVCDLDHRRELFRTEGDARDCGGPRSVSYRASLGWIGLWLRSAQEGRARYGHGRALPTDRQQLFQGARPGRGADLALVDQAHAGDSGLGLLKLG